MSSPVAAIVAAAGLSRRMGSCKQLLDLGGKTALARCLETLHAGGIGEIVVVVGATGGLVAAEAGRFPVRVVVNEDPDGDMASSVRVGRRFLADHVSGVVVALCDYPLVTTATISRLVSRHREAPGAILIPSHGGRRGHPTLFPTACLNELEAGGTLRDVVRVDTGRLQLLEVDDPGILLDMDTPEDYGALQRHWGRAKGGTMHTEQKTLTEFSRDDRIRGAIWGQFLGDAFCLGSHWIYDLAELDHRFPGGPQGFETPAAGHYHFGKKAGDLTHYGDGALLLLQSLAERGSFDTIDFGSRFVELFDSPGYGGYRDHATKETIARFHAHRARHPGGRFAFQDGADDDQPATVSRLAPLAALYFRDDAYLSVVEQATLVCQNNRRAVAYAQAHALILRELFSGSPFEDAVGSAAGFMATLGGAGAEVSARINGALAVRDLDVREATLRFGQVCPLAASFPAAIQCALRHGDDFAGALRATAGAGGDNAGRAAMIGAWLGAVLGIGALPSRWREGLAAQATIAACVERIIGAAGKAG